MSSLKRAREEPSARVARTKELTGTDLTNVKVLVVGAGGIGFDVSEFLVMGQPSPTLDRPTWEAEWGVTDPARQRGGCELLLGSTDGTVYSLLLTNAHHHSRPPALSLTLTPLHEWSVAFPLRSLFLQPRSRGGAGAAGSESEEQAIEMDYRQRELLKEKEALLQSLDFARTCSNSRIQTGGSGNSFCRSKEEALRR